MIIKVAVYLYLLISCAECFPKTSQETGNDIETFLMQNQITAKDIHKKDEKRPDKFMNDLMEVQRTYRNLKQKWQRIMEEKSAVMRIASTTSSTTTTTSSEIQEIDVDVFEAPEKFQDVSEPDSTFDDSEFIDISAKNATEELNEIQAAIREAFVKTEPVPTAQVNVVNEINPPTLFEILGPTTKKRSVEETTTARSLLSSFGGEQNVATNWRHTLGSKEENMEDPFEGSPEVESTTTTTTISTTPTPTTSTTPMTTPTTTTVTTTTTTPPPVTTTTLPPHILPKSTFVSSGSNPSANPSTTLFRHPSPVQIPFYGAPTTTGHREVLTTQKLRRPTTPEPPILIDGEETFLENSDGQSEDEEEVEVPMNEESDTDYDITVSEVSTTPAPIENNEDYVEETFSKEASSESSAVLGSPPGTENNGLFGVGKGPEALSDFPSAPVGGSFGIGKAPKPFEESLGFSSLEEMASPQSDPPASFGIGKAPEPPSSETFGSPPSSNFGSFGSPPGIGRAPPGSIQTSTPPKPTPQQFPTLVNQVEEFFNDEGSSSSLGSFASAESGVGSPIANIAVAQHIEVLEPKGAFGTKIATLNQKAYRPPLFPSPMSSQAVQMKAVRNPYIQRTTMEPIGPHGLAEPDVINSADMELPAWGMKDNGIMNKARREYQKEFEKQIRDVREIDEEINKISQMNDNGRSKPGQRCSQVYAHTLSLQQIEKMSEFLGLADVANVIRGASDLTRKPENDIAKLETDLEDKRKLIAKVEILLSLSESRALLYDLMNEQKVIVEKMENQALEMLQKTNYRPITPSPVSAISDISELSSAVRQVLGSSVAKKGWSNMKQRKGKKEKKVFEVVKVPEFDRFANNANNKIGHLQETAEIVEPMLTQNDQFGRQPVIIHRRPLPLAPPTMAPLITRPAQRAAHHMTASKALPPPFHPPSDSQVTENESVHELIDMLHADIVQLRERQKEIRRSPAEEEEKICRRVQCDFEKADLCNLESSHDETTRLRNKLRKRDKRSAPIDLLAESSSIADDLLPYTFRAWSIWAGRTSDKQKQIDIGPDFTSQNKHFAAVFLEPQQAGILSVPLVLSPTSTKIRLRLFEGTRGVRLRVCCDRWCPLETENGLYRGHRMWLRKTITCPANTQTLAFECLNDGSDRGACGIDDIFVDSTRCRRFFDEPDQS